jgi:hypothetical protein
MHNPVSPRLIVPLVWSGRPALSIVVVAGFLFAAIAAADGVAGTSATEGPAGVRSAETARVTGVSCVDIRVDQKRVASMSAPCTRWV